MDTHISVVTKKDDNDRERTFLRLSHPNVPPFDRELSPYEMMLLITRLSIELKREMEYKEYEYHTEEH